LCAQVPHGDAGQGAPPTPFGAYIDLLLRASSRLQREEMGPKRVRFAPGC
jgi:hypothetical protein